MQNIRFKQAQNLLEKSANRAGGTTTFKVPQSGHIDVKKFENIFKNIISGEEFIYSSLPTHNLSKDEAKEFVDFLILARDNIDSILTDFKVIEKQEEKIDIGKLTDNILFITSKNNFKKVLTGNIFRDIIPVLIYIIPINLESERNKKEQ